jgi:hypothetical protein
LKRKAAHRRRRVPVSGRAPARRLGPCWALREKGTRISYSNPFPTGKPGPSSGVARGARLLQLSGSGERTSCGGERTRQSRRRGTVATSPASRPRGAFDVAAPLCWGVLAASPPLLSLMQLSQRRPAVHECLTLFRLMLWGQSGLWKTVATPVPGVLAGSAERGTCRGASDTGAATGRLQRAPFDAAEVSSIRLTCHYFGKEGFSGPRPPVVFQKNAWAPLV